MTKRTNCINRSKIDDNSNRLEASREKCRKKYRKCAMKIGIVAIIIVLSLILNEAITGEDTNNNDNNDNNVKQKEMAYISKAQNTCKGPSKAYIMCSSTHVSNLNAFINELVTKGSWTKIPILQIYKITFPENTLKSNWLTTIDVEQLEFIQCTALNHIEDGAFNDKTFKNLKRLRFTNIQISNFRREVFLGLSNVHTLEIQETNREIMFASDVLEHLTALSTLQVQKSIYSPEAVKNLTGTLHLTQLLIVDYSFNPNLFSIPKNAFRTPNIASIYLENSGLKEIDEAAFRNCKKIQKVHMKSNQLTALSEKVFQDVEKFSTIELTISNNLWNCTCALNWMKQLILKDINDARCNDDNENEKDFMEDFCGTTYTPKTSTVLTTSTDISTNSATDSETMSTSITEEPTVILSTTLDVNTTEIPTMTTWTIHPTNETDVTFNNTTIETTTDITTFEPGAETTPTNEEPIDSTTSNITTCVPGAETTPATEEPPTWPNTTIPVEESTTSPPSSNTEEPIYTTSTHTTLLPTELPTIPPPPDPGLQEMTCIDYQLDYKQSTGRRNVYTEDDFQEYVEIDSPTNKIVVEEYKNGVFKVTRYGFSHFDALIWMESPNISNTGCFVNLDYVSYLKCFSPDKLYVLCMMLDGENTVSPLDCVSVQTNRPTDNQTWLDNSYKLPVILSSVFLLLFVIGLTGVLVFFYIRQHPKVLKGNKRVVVVQRENSKTDVIVMPQKKPSRVFIQEEVVDRRFDNREHRGRHNAVYLSQMSQRYIRVRGHKLPLVRSNSSGSLRSTTTYVDAVEPELERRMDRRSRPPIAEYFDHPPPLPPPRSNYDYLM